MSFWSTVIGWFNGSTKAPPTQDMTTEALEAEYRTLYSADEPSPFEQFRMDAIEAQLLVRGLWIYKGLVGVGFYSTKTNYEAR